MEFQLDCFYLLGLFWLPLVEIQILSLNLTCGKLLSMMKPQLIIIEEIAGTPVKGGCSSCKDVIFALSGTGFTSNKQKLEILFREHFRTVHEGETSNLA